MSNEHETTTALYCVECSVLSVVSLVLQKFSNMFANVTCLSAAVNFNVSNTCTCTHVVCKVCLLKDCLCMLFH